jgi:hypothetical protein
MYPDPVRYLQLLLQVGVTGMACLASTVRISNDACRISCPFLNSYNYVVAIIPIISSMVCCTLTAPPPLLW